jgi:hypothetical protein
MLASRMRFPAHERRATRRNFRWGKFRVGGPRWIRGCFADSGGRARTRQSMGALVSPQAQADERGDRERDLAQESSWVGWLAGSRQVSRAFWHGNSVVVFARPSRQVLAPYQKRNAAQRIAAAAHCQAIVAGMEGRVQVTGGRRHDEDAIPRPKHSARPLRSLAVVFSGCGT